MQCLFDGDQGWGILWIHRMASSLFLSFKHCQKVKDQQLSGNMSKLSSYFLN